MTTNGCGRTLLPVAVLCLSISAETSAGQTAEQLNPAAASKSGAVKGQTTAVVPAAAEEIVVSARRRKERCARRSSLCYSLSAKQLENSAVVDTRELISVVPGLTITHGGFGLQPNIRGIGSTNGLPGDEANVSTYIDGVYMSQQYANFDDYPDVERIGGFKGPAGDAVRPECYGRRHIGDH